MSYAVMRAMKFKGGSDLAGIQIHNRREKEHSNTNPDYDPLKSHLNYALVQSPPEKTFNQIIDERLAIGYKGKIVKGELKPTAIRKDAVKMVEILFASDKAFFDTLTSSEQRKYFEDCLSWAKKRFGEENIFSAVVHVADEHRDGSPHMHLDFVPLTADGELSANKILGGRIALQKMQDDFWETVGKPWGLERGERADLADENAPVPRKHKTDKEFKAEKAQEQAELKLKETLGDLEKIRNACFECERDYFALKDRNTALKKENENIAVKAAEKRIQALEAQAMCSTLAEQERALNERISALKSEEEKYTDLELKSFASKRTEEFNNYLKNNEKETYDLYSKSRQKWTNEVYFSKITYIESIPTEHIKWFCLQAIQKNLRYTVKPSISEKVKGFKYNSEDRPKIEQIYGLLYKNQESFRVKQKTHVVPAELKSFNKHLIENNISFLYQVIKNGEVDYLIKKEDVPLFEKIYDEIKSPVIEEKANQPKQDKTVTQQPDADQTYFRRR